MKFYSVTIQMKATEQYFSVVLLNYAVEMVLTFESVDLCGHLHEIYRAELSCSSVSLLYCTMKVVSTFKSVDEILTPGHSNKSY